MIWHGTLAKQLMQRSHWWAVISYIIWCYVIIVHVLKSILIFIWKRGSRDRELNIIYKFNYQQINFIHSLYTGVTILNNSDIYVLEYHHNRQILYFAISILIYLYILLNNMKYFPL